MQYTAAVSQSKVTSLEKKIVEAKKATTMKEEELKEELTKTQKLAAAKLEQKRALAEQSEKVAQVQLELKKSTMEHNRLMCEKTTLERSLETEHMTVLRQQQLIDDATAATRISNEDGEALKKDGDRLRKREDQFKRDISKLKRENGLALGHIQARDKVLSKSASDDSHGEQIIVSLEGATKREAFLEYEVLDENGVSRFNSSSVCKTLLLKILECSADSNLTLYSYINT